MPFGLLLDLWECHKQYVGISKPKVEHYIEDIIPDGIQEVSIMADTFGLKIGLEGEKEFKSQLAEINQTFKVLGSEMKLVDSEFEKNDTSMQAVSARSEVLKKSISEQEKKVNTLRQA